MRYFAIDDVGEHQFRFTFERIAPTAAASGADANNLAGQHRLAIDQAAEIAGVAFNVDCDAERQPGFAAVDPIAAEPDPIRSDDGAAIDQGAIMLLVA